MRDALEYRLTDENFRGFVAASDSLTALKARDPAARAYLERDLSQAPSTESDAGLRHLQSNPAVVAAIESAGISVRDYFVAAIALASAQTAAATPTDVPPTPSLEANREFLSRQQGALERLGQQRVGLPPVRVTPP